MRGLPGCFGGQRFCCFATNSIRKAMLVRIVAMLTKLLERFDPEQFRVRKSLSDPVVPFEHEHDDEHEHDC
jgi:hypothetical protein